MGEKALGKYPVSSILHLSSYAHSTAECTADHLTLGMLEHIDFQVGSTKSKTWDCKGVSPAQIKEGVRVRYYPARGINSVKSEGTARMTPWENVNGYSVVHVKLDSGVTIHSAHLEHLDLIVGEAK